MEAKEQKKTGGIYWRIITTHPVTSSEQAMQIIEWYKQRWYIEQIHRLLKTEGFRIERLLRKESQAQLFYKKALLSSTICMKAGLCIKNFQKMCPHSSPFGV